MFLHFCLQLAASFHSGCKPQIAIEPFLRVQNCFEPSTNLELFRVIQNQKVPTDNREHISCMLPVSSIIFLGFSMAPTAEKE